jgi:hypothetical protein
MKLTNKHSYVKHLRRYKNSEIARRRGWLSIRDHGHPTEKYRLKLPPLGHTVSGSAKAGLVLARLAKRSCPVQGKRTRLTKPRP